MPIPSRETELYLLTIVFSAYGLSFFADAKHRKNYGKVRG